MKHIIVLILMLLVVSCSRKSEKIPESAENEIVSIEVKPKDTKDVLRWENYIDSISIIPLETDEKSVFGRVERFMYKNDNFYILDNALKEIFIFNHEGIFQSKINNRGRGPKQYRLIYDFFVDSLNNLIILDYQKIHVLDYIHDNINTIKINSTGEVYNLCYFNNSNFYTFNGLVSNGEDNYLLTKYVNGKTKKLYKNSFDVFLTTRFIENGDGFLMIPPFYDNHIYKITKDSVKISYEIDFDGNFFQTEGFHKNGIYSNQEINQYKKNSEVCHSIQSFFETKNFVFFKYISGGNYFYVTYNKNKDNTETFCNSLLYGEIPINIKGYYEKENVLFALLEPHILNNRSLANLVSRHHSLSSLENLNESQNPVIIKLFLQ